MQESKLVLDNWLPDTSSQDFSVWSDWTPKQISAFQNVSVCLVINSQVGS